MAVPFLLDLQNPRIKDSLRQRAARRAHNYGRRNSAMQNRRKKTLKKVQNVKVNVAGTSCAESEKEKRIPNFCSLELCSGSPYKIWTNYVIINWAPFWFLYSGLHIVRRLSAGSVWARTCRGARSCAPQPFRERRGVRAAEYQWARLKRHGSSRRRLSSFRAPPSGLHGLIFKTTS